MANKIKTLYVVHHSHTDIGYTDLQEKVIDCQVDNLREAMRILQKPGNEAFRWNCETYFCVERFLETAQPQEQDAFFDFVRQGRIGISATYLNFCDLIPSDILFARIAEMRGKFKSQGIDVTTAMIADINGISMGQRNALLDNGIEFLFTNIHTHHGMYPLYQNQNAYWWENAQGKRLLVWNGEHYNLGNALGIKPNRGANFMTQSYIGGHQDTAAADALKTALDLYLKECEESNYPYDFIISSVSGVFSDNAPPNDEILRTIEAYHQLGTGIELRMVSLGELYQELSGKLGDLPVYRGDLNDWWGNGVGSTPYTVKHFKEALRTYRLAGKLDPAVYEKYPALARQAQDNFLLYSEHTWGHSATVTDPYETMVINLDIRKHSYASKAHEAAAMLQNRAMMSRGGILRYYNTNGRVRAVFTGGRDAEAAVEFYIETMYLKALRVTCTDGREMEIQLSAHPRGIRVSFTDTFRAGETKEYCYEEQAAPKEHINTRHAFCGAERVRDIENDFDLETYRLPHELESDGFLIRYEVGAGFTELLNKRSGENLLAGTPHKFFTPLYERTALRHDAYEERRLIGRNIRGAHAELFAAKLQSVRIVERGPVFILAEFGFSLEGATHCALRLKLWRRLPRIEFALRTAKTLSTDVESMFMPIALNLPESALWLKKGAEAFRPGIDQIPGTCMEYWMSDSGAAYCGKKGSVLVSTPDTALIYMGEMKSHAIRLCDNKEENNRRPAYSWIMNNTWETNFKMDLSGFGEFCYRLELTDATDPEACFTEMENPSDAFAYITE